MNSQSSTMKSPTAGGCGCGGGHSGCDGGCGGSCGGQCGCTSGAGVAGVPAFVRPRFFGGMLLTEDDLQAIDDYAVAKRRLTNRHMFGSGVVCGLDVDCDPCKPGWLTVSPGYALDCCGNDIVVGCPEKLDALALLSDLRKREGLDCGDPCDKQTDRTYVLVVSYSEQPADPVAPYVQDDCAVGDCDFSRVREGYRFELVCDVQDPDPSLFDRLSQCAEQGDPRGEHAAKLIQMAHLAKTQIIARAAEEAGEFPTVPIPRVAEFDAAPRAGIVSAAELLGRSTAVLAAAAVHDAKLGPSIGGLTAERRDRISERSRRLAEDFLESDELKELSDVERRRVTVVLEAAKAQQNLEQLSVGQRVWLAEGYEAADAARTFTKAAESVRASIVRKLEETGRGNCREREEVQRLALGQLDENSIDRVYRLGQSFWSIVVGCLCDLVNPPCPQCTETRVALAAVRIEGCEVVDVCTLTRQWVLAPRNLNYWVPIVDVLRRLLLERCCDRDYRPTADRELESLQQLWTRTLSLVRSPLDSLEYNALHEVLSKPAETATAATAASATATPAPTAPAASDLAEDARVATLEKQVEELNEQVRKLTGGGPP
jgi:hypothetical protein